MEKASVSGGSDGSAGDSDEGELGLSEEDGRRWAGKAKLESIEDELHGTPSAEEILVESYRTVTLHAEVAQEELEVSTKVPFLWEKRRVAKRAKTPLITSTSKVAKQSASPKTPLIASSSKVAEQPTSPKQLAEHLSHPKADVASSQSVNTVETRPRPSLKRHDRAGQDQVQVRQVFWLLALISSSVCTTLEDAGESQDETSRFGHSTENNSLKKQTTITFAATAGPKENSQSERVREEPIAEDSGSSFSDDKTAAQAGWVGLCSADQRL